MYTGEASFFLVCLVLAAGVRFATGDSPADLAAAFLAGGVFLGVTDLEEESAFRVLMTKNQLVKKFVANLFCKIRTKPIYSN